MRSSEPPRLADGPAAAIPAERRVAFVGLGRMGGGMAARLLRAGFAVRCFVRRPAAAEHWRAQGASVHTQLHEACAGAHAVITMLSDDEASRAVWLGERGVLSAPLADGALAIECSTLSHGWMLELASAASSAGLRFLDAPVTGLPADAAAGRLTLLVGAMPADLAAAEPLLAPLAERVVRFGPPGSGTAYKLMINLMGAVQLAACAEGLALAERAGLNLGTVCEALASGQAASPQVVRLAARIRAADHDSDVVFTPQLRAKDVRYARAMARSLNVGTPFGAAAQAAYERLCAMLEARAAGATNESAIIDVARGETP